MANQSHERWSKYELMAMEEDEVFSFPSLFSPLDFSGSGYSPFDYQWSFLSQECAFDPLPLMEMFVNDPLYSSMDLAPSQSVVQGDYLYDYVCGFALWNEMNGEEATGLETENQQLFVLNENNREMNRVEVQDSEKKAIKRPREERNSSSSKMLTRQTISQYFYMPITQAAKQLNIGLTLLKKRCRELGICRWPHRKLMSLQTLIKNVQELSREEGEGAEQKLREALEILEREKKLMEEIPDMEMKDKTKRLRQACFKANYKKRKLTGMNQLRLPSSSINHASSYGMIDSGDVHEEEEMRSLLSDCFSSSNNLFQV